MNFKTLKCDDIRELINMAKCQIEFNVRTKLTLSPICIIF